VLYIPVLSMPAMKEVAIAEVGIGAALAWIP
jgi:hypothetical protein